MARSPTVHENQAEDVKEALCADGRAAQEPEHVGDGVRDNDDGSTEPAVAFFVTLSEPRRGAVDSLEDGGGDDEKMEAVMEAAEAMLGGRIGEAEGVIGEARKWRGVVAERRRAGDGWRRLAKEANADVVLDAPARGEAVAPLEHQREAVPAVVAVGVADLNGGLLAPALLHAPLPRHLLPPGGGRCRGRGEGHCSRRVGFRLEPVTRRDGGGAPSGVLELGVLGRRGE